MRRCHTLVQFGAILIIFLGLMVTANADNKAAGEKKILVKINRQTLFAVQANKLVYEFNVVTGRPGKETTTGHYRVFKKVKDYTSKTYGSPMPYSMFFSKDGKAIHGTQWATLRSYLHVYITESVGSHGCVGLTEKDAKLLYEWAPNGTSIWVLEGTTNENERLKGYR